MTGSVFLSENNPLACEFVGLSFHIRKGGDRRRYSEESIRKAAKQMGSDILEKPLLVIRMPCGEEYRYETFDDIPLENVMCSCGDETHIVVLWVEG